MLSDKRTDAVSPVVGTMLMLTLVIILAAVLSGYAGGIAGSETNSGGDLRITAHTTITNTGGDDSRFFIDVISCTPLQTKNLKLKTSWKTYNKTGELVSSDTTVSAGVENFDYTVGNTENKGVAPVENDSGEICDFGDYALMAGSRMEAYPAEEYNDFSYESGFSGDMMQAVLGDDWKNLQSGDVVSVMLIYVPTGTIVYDEDVYVNAKSR
ncbi:FlaG/FlaF family flagellin (archaellin) [Methanomicrobium sp. W14]|uniref:type IV pilin N-terminal domain-containing protein n=1 Tax=Methanomicrobium sp. W14 TaxID=2817839 RepID=UPI001AE49472|nr:type IV pilin N-terminal domain-containing protein [Methanomicrobium sp. W14]MBP2134387.1 FlaG/FlaF family flagellin (archaellin) [Methanomicrobium sp. W14]